MSAKFDTLRYAKELEATGVARELAVKQAELLHEEVLANVATKHDLQSLKLELTGKLAELELRLTLRLGAMIVAAVGVLIAAQKLL